jgi:hypothetical protein
LLAELFLSREGELSLTELAARAETAYGSTHREVERLVHAGLLQERRVGKTRLIRPNPASPLAAPVRSLVLVAAGPVPLLVEELRKIDGVDFAFVFGSFAERMAGIEGPPPNDIDVMVVGAPDPLEVYAACQRVGDAVDRPVNPVIMTRQEWQGDTGFLENVRKSPVIAIIGDVAWPSLP